MTELRLMWRNSRMVVLCAICAALYAAVLVPFKVVPLIPGITELRPANAVPVVCSFLFGPAAAWGSAIGNMIGDFFGGIGPGGFFGFLGNFAYGYIPYKVWNVIADSDGPSFRTPSAIAKYVFACLVASLLCADLVGWGDNMLALRPFAVLGNIIIVNNMAAALALAPFILAAVYPRVRNGRLLYADVMPELPRRPMLTRASGLVMLIVGGLGAWVFGNLISTGAWRPLFLSAALTEAPYDKSIAIVVTPFMVMAAGGLALM